MASCLRAAFATIRRHRLRKEKEPHVPTNAISGTKNRNGARKPRLTTTIMLAALASVGIATPALAYTDEDAYTAVSNTAMSITGDILFDDFSITFANGETLEFADLVADNFIVDGESVPASLYRVRNPADPVLEGGNRLCGSGDVSYIAAWGTDLTIIGVFTGDEPPQSSDEICASYSYQD